MYKPSKYVIAAVLAVIIVTTTIILIIVTERQYRVKPITIATRLYEPNRTDFIVYLIMSALRYNRNGSDKLCYDAKVSTYASEMMYVNSTVTDLFKSKLEYECNMNIGEYIEFDFPHNYNDFVQYIRQDAFVKYLSNPQWKTVGIASRGVKRWYVVLWNVKCSNEVEIPKDVISDFAQ